MGLEGENGGSEKGDKGIKWEESVGRWGRENEEVWIGDWKVRIEKWKV